MSNQIKELMVLLTITITLMCFPLWLIAAEGQGGLPTPWTAAYSVGEWVVDKVTTKPRSGFHSPERQAKFDKWSKEDWIKDDPYACMWDPNWFYTKPRIMSSIHSKLDVCQ